MRPILLELFGTPVYSYGFMVAVAFIVGYFIVLRRSEHVGISSEQLADFALLLAVCGIIGARILYVLIGWEYYSTRPLAILDLRGGGLSFHGGAILAIIAGVWYVRRHRLKMGRLADAVAPAFSLGVGLVRLGCLMNGCCYGLASTVPWAFDCSYLHDASRHPTQLYESAAMFIIFFYLLRRGRHGKFPGYLLVLFTVLYSVVRFVVEFFRDVPQFWPPLSMAQVASLAIIVLGIGWIIVAGRRYTPQSKEYQG